MKDKHCGCCGRLLEQPNGEYYCPECDMWDDECEPVEDKEKRLSNGR